MKYILIVGAKDSGKSTTMDAVCKTLNPDRIFQLNSENEFLEVDSKVEIMNGTYIIEVKGQIILVVAGAPTEQDITITILVEIAIKFKIRIDFAIVAMRAFEKKKDFDTRNELKQLGECLLETRIWKIHADNYKETPEWKERIRDIADLINT